jgi:hypothetical protein
VLTYRVQEFLTHNFVSRLKVNPLQNIQRHNIYIKASRLLFVLLVVVCVVQLLFVLFYVLFVCKCVLPPGDNQIAVNKYISMA